MNAAGFALTLVLALGAFLLPRRLAALSVLAAVCYITQFQQVVTLRFHVTAIRIVLLGGMFRILARGEFRGCHLNKIDWALIGYTAAVTLIPSLRERTSEQLVYRLGGAYEDSGRSVSGR